MEPKTLIKSRAVLQSLKGGSEFQKYQNYDHLLQCIWRDVLRDAKMGKTNFVYILPNYAQPNTPFVIEEFEEIVKNEYPDCTVKYVETIGLKMIERAITIDWS